MEANVFFEKEDVVNYAQGYNGKIIPLFEMGVAHDHIAVCCRCSSEISSPAQTTP